jgi:hypothetical protein
MLALSPREPERLASSSSSSPVASLEELARLCARTTFQILPNARVLRGCCGDTCYADTIDADGSFEAAQDFNLSWRPPHHPFQIDRFGYDARAAHGVRRRLLAARDGGIDRLAVVRSREIETDAGPRTTVFAFQWERGHEVELFSSDDWDFVGTGAWSDDRVVAPFYPSPARRREGAGARMIVLSGSPATNLPRLLVDAAFAPHAFASSRDGAAVVVGERAGQLTVHRWQAGSDAVAVDAFVGLRSPGPVTEERSPIAIQATGHVPPDRVGDIFVATAPSASTTAEIVVLRFDGAAWSTSLRVATSKVFQGFAWPPDGAMWMLLGDAASPSGDRSSEIWRRAPQDVDAWEKLAIPELASGEVVAERLVPIVGRDMALLGTRHAHGRVRQGFYRVRMPSSPGAPPPVEVLDRPRRDEASPASRDLHALIEETTPLCDGDDLHMLPRLRVVRGCCEDGCRAFEIGRDGVELRDVPYDLGLGGLPADTPRILAAAGEWPRRAQLVAQRRDGGFAIAEARKGAATRWLDGGEPGTLPLVGAWSSGSSLTWGPSGSSPLRLIGGPRVPIPRVPVAADPSVVVGFASAPSGHAILVRSIGSVRPRDDFRGVDARFDGLEILRFTPGATEPTSTRFPELTWEVSEREMRSDFEPVVMLAPDDAYAVARSKSTGEEVLLHFDGVAWQTSLALGRHDRFMQLVTTPDGARWVLAATTPFGGGLWRLARRGEAWTEVGKLPLGDAFLRPSAMMAVGDHDLILLTAYIGGPRRQQALHRLRVVPAGAPAP